MMMILSLFNEDVNEEKLLSRRLEGAGSTLQSILRKRTSPREHFIIILRLGMVRMMLYHHGGMMMVTTSDLTFDYVYDTSFVCPGSVFLRCVS